ncbi:ABC transporter substrate-binding protein [Caryophanon tenue]|uniref:BMP family ABC transporter substrate-binding protein n=1 Tax=Caryophanon tenue TaxID=33978 RepID=A0A1C0Y884_9BACL|nr:ABC transporter substrate-binding protein [Caryophanon tenue]OCS83386.1 BMP family ABC transporter substrate-binding protein [Caryophanon tenue]
MKKVKWQLVLMMLAVVMVLAACGSNSDDGASEETETNDTSSTDATTGDTFKIGITQLVEHPSLDAAREGFKTALKDAGINAEYDEQLAQGDNSLNTTIAQNLATSGADLIFANSTPSAQAALAQTTEIPIVFTSVTDAVAAQLVQSMDAPGGNVTGTVDLHPETIDKTLAFIQELGATTVGMVYNAGEQNSVEQVKLVKEKAAALGITIVEASVSTSAEVKQAAESLVGKAEAFYIITDNTVVSALESVIDVANTNKLPLVVGELDSVARGGLAAYGFEYYDIGYEAGEMAVKILKGEATPAELPAQYPQNLKLVINKSVADALGLEIDESWGAELLE